MKKIFLLLFMISMLISSYAKAENNIYIVKNGDTLCGIGLKFGISCKNMIANFSKNPNLIHPGDKFEFNKYNGLLGGLVSKPYTFSPNTTIYSSQVNSDFDTLYTLVNGNLNNANIIAGAAISSTKISGTAIVSTGATYQSINGSTTVFGALIVSSTENYFRVPVMTTAQRNALTNLQAGAIIYSSDDAQFYVREGSSWSAISPAAETALANTTTKGVVQESTTSSNFSGNPTGSTNARLFISPATLTTSSDATSKAGYIPVLNTSSLLHSSFGGGVNSLAQLNTSSLVVQNPASATSTPGTSSTIPFTTASGTIPLGFIATSTSNNHQFLRSTSTGVYWSDLGIRQASSTASRVLNATYQNTSTFPKFVSITGLIGQPGDIIQVFVSSTASSGFEVHQLKHTGGSWSGNFPMTFIVPPNWYYRTFASGATVGYYNWYEMEL